MKDYNVYEAWSRLALGVVLAVIILLQVYQLEAVDPDRLERVSETVQTAMWLLTVWMIMPLIGGLAKALKDSISFTRSRGETA